jgi:hypothetical protein
MKCISQGLRVNNTLEKLDLTGNSNLIIRWHVFILLSCLDNLIGVEGIEYIGCILSSNTRISEIDLTSKLKEKNAFPTYIIYSSLLNSIQIIISETKEQNV